MMTDRSSLCSDRREVKSLKVMMPFWIFNKREVSSPRPFIPDTKVLDVRVERGNTPTHLVIALINSDLAPPEGAIITIHTGSDFNCWETTPAKMVFKM